MRSAKNLETEILRCATAGIEDLAMTQRKDGLLSNRKLSYKWYKKKD